MLLRGEAQRGWERTEEGVRGEGDDRKTKGVREELRWNTLEMLGDLWDCLLEHMLLGSVEIEQER